ncbi:MAG TPA: hypothetical protein VLG50_05165 [Candidatus Saccharimonadales bacterium]|nr:hypothetical protein [Candidatus Saccharimonadales bacterium]
MDGDIKQLIEEMDYIKKILNITYRTCDQCHQTQLLNTKLRDCDICHKNCCDQCMHYNKRCNDCKSHVCKDKDHWHECEYCEIGYCVKCLLWCDQCGYFCPDMTQCQFYNDTEGSCLYCPKCYPIMFKNHDRFCIKHIHTI